MVSCWFRASEKRRHQYASELKSTRWWMWNGHGCDLKRDTVGPTQQGKTQVELRLKQIRARGRAGHFAPQEAAARMATSDFGRRAEGNNTPVALRRELLKGMAE
jgi:hypothetical protein